MSIRPSLALTAIALAAAATVAACGGGGSSGPSFLQQVPSAAPGAPTPTPSPRAPSPAPTATVTAPSPTPTSTVSTQQVVKMALPTTAIGTVVDPTFGLVGGYTQTTFSQTLAFAPGSQIMIQNAQSTGFQHTFNVISTSSFPANPSLTFTASGGPIGTGFASGIVNPGQTVGPFTLTAGTYYIGCAFHYGFTPSMRTVLQVAAGATPGPQATAPPSATPPPVGGGY